MNTVGESHDSKVLKWKQQITPKLQLREVCTCIVSLNSTETDSYQCFCSLVCIPRIMQECRQGEGLISLLTDAYKKIYMEKV